MLGSKWKALRCMVGALSAALLLILCVTLLPTFVRADTEGDFSYTVSNGQATVTNYTGIGGDVTIPATLGGCPVTSIGYAAFFDCSSLTSIIIPDGVTSIEGDAFRNCSSLESITIGNGVTSIGGDAFDRCSSLAGIWVDEQNPNYCSDKYGVLFNKNRTELIQCPSCLSGIYWIPDSVTSIGYAAFFDCGSLTSIIIPDSVASVGYAAFLGCSSLAGIWVDEQNPNYCSDKYGVLFNKNGTELIQCPGGLSGVYRIPDGVTSIGGDAFADCGSLTDITIPDDVTSIGDYAFTNCSSLKSITIGNGVTSIADGTFAYCSSLESVTIGNGVTSIGDGAFWNCSSLKSITIPDSVTSIYSRAFWNCSSLESITIPDSVISIYEAFWNCSSLKNVYYEGTEAQWKEIFIISEEDLTNATIHYESTGMILGDMSGDGVVTDTDAIYLLRYTLFGEGNYPLAGGGDVNSDGAVTDADAVYLLRYTLFPENYPLYPQKEEV